MVNAMDILIRPDIFDGQVKAFFTGKSLGADRDKISKVFSIDKDDIYLPLQKHSDIVWLLNSDRTPVTADAVITQAKGILIGVQVADCVPALLHDKKNSVVGAVHAGWRGTSLQIMKKTILFLVEQFDSDPHNINVAFGPSIRGNCYAVSTEVKDAVLKATGPGDYVIPRDGKFCMDLSSANMLQALSAGIPLKNIWRSHECTFCNPRDFHSYRYHKDYAGRQGGFIGIF
jgi:hypothetical protein